MLLPKKILGAGIATILFCTASTAAMANPCDNAFLASWNANCTSAALAPEGQTGQLGINTGAPYVDRPAVWQRHSAEPQTIPFSGPYKAGEILIDLKNQYLYLVEAGSKATRFVVGTGKQGIEIPTTERKVFAMVEYPNWDDGKGNTTNKLWVRGPAGLLGARGLYLQTAAGVNEGIAIHGTNAPELLGKPDGQRRVSNGCIRMHNKDITYLYEHVGIGTRVRVFKNNELAPYFAATPRMASASVTTPR